MLFVDFPVSYGSKGRPVLQSARSCAAPYGENKYVYGEPHSGRGSSATGRKSNLMNQQYILPKVF